jgi:hypothetical protein
MVVHNRAICEERAAVSRVRLGRTHSRSHAGCGDCGALFGAIPLALGTVLALSELGRHTDALAPRQEAVDNYWELARIAPDRYRSRLARSLSNLGATFRPK